MPNPIFINYRESTHGQNANGYIDVSNRPCRTIWSNFTAQHNKDGTHKIALIDTDIWEMEEGSYTGNATDDRTISLTNTGLDVKFVRIFSAHLAYTWFATADMMTAYPYAICTQGFSALDHIQAMGVGSFEIGASNDVNENGILFHYIVYGAQT